MGEQEVQVGVAFRIEGHGDGPQRFGRQQQHQLHAEAGPGNGDALARTHTQALQVQPALQQRVGKLRIGEFGAVLVQRGPLRRARREGLDVVGGGGQRRRSHGAADQITSRR